MLVASSFRSTPETLWRWLSRLREVSSPQRNFNSYAEDPAAATQAFRLRREWYQTQNQITNTKDVW